MATLSKREKMRQLKEQRIQSMKASVAAEQETEQIPQPEESAPEYLEQNPAYVNDATQNAGRTQEYTEQTLPDVNDATQDINLSSQNDVQTSQNTPITSMKAAEHPVLTENTAITPQTQVSPTSTVASTTSMASVGMSQPELLFAQESLEESAIFTVLDTRYKSSAAECKTVTLMLRTDNAEYTNIRSRQLGMAYQDYLGLLIEEERRRVDISTVNAFSIRHPQKGTSVRKLAAIRVDVNEFLKQSAMAHGMRISEYANYIIDNERQREETNGFRQPSI